MRIKFETYMEQKTETYVMPVAHCISGKNYFPIDLKGNFEEF